MQVKEILRVKGNRLLSIEPSGHASDAVKTMAKENLGELKVSEIMVRDRVTAAPEMEVNDLRRTMLESGARYLPVIKDARLLGVISFRDVAKAVLEEQDFENSML